MFLLLCFFGPVSAGKQELLFWDARKEHECGRNFRWRTPVKMADNNQNLKGFLYSKLNFDGLCKILVVFDG